MKGTPMEPDAVYAVYDPPQAGLPVLGVLLRTKKPIQVFAFENFEQARAFLTIHGTRIDSENSGAGAEECASQNDT
ncbi:hypothetical protein [Mesorhizobium sp. CN2-181]|uniref:hypothetical protein n=1 Tax=Mesorhizobium yinganensis TaxID=3157707 RepID=UPI0032B77D2D